MHTEIANPRHLTGTLAETSSPTGAPRTPTALPRVRATTAAALRRVLSAQLLVHRAERRGAATWETSPAERERALAIMEAIVGGTPRAGELDELARQHLIDREAHNALFWQPWKMPSMDSRSTEHVQAALSSGRGVLASSCHLGPIFLTFWPLTKMRTGYSVAGPWFFEEPTPDYWGRRLAHWRKGLEQRDERLLPSQGVFATLRGLLEQGELAIIYFDMPGSRRTQFLGKPVTLATGTVRLAVEADALVLPLRARRDGHRVWTDAQAPLDPREFSGHEQLQDALAGAHERWILERPSALEDPNRRGAWEGGASAREWARPELIHGRP